MAARGCAGHPQTRQYKAGRAADQLKAGDSRRGVEDGYVFTTGRANSYQDP
jgi:hypothetical protein